MRVLAAMSGGVDSAVAAARAVEAGHEVTGVHLALSANPQSFRTGARGCCTIEDSRDARRAADVIGIPFYVWDLAERFREDVIDDVFVELLGHVPHVERDADHVSGPASVARVFQRAAPAGAGAIGLRVGGQREVDTGHLVPGVGGARGGDGGVDPARHGGEYAKSHDAIEGTRSGAPHAS